MKTVIEANGLCATFQHKKQVHKALDEVSFTVEAGKTVGFIGPNGAGKTTALHVLLGFLSPDSGTAQLLGKDASSAESRSQIGYLSEHPECYKYMTAREYLEMTAKLFDIPKSERKERVDHLLNEVELIAHANKRIATYSRGMLQRIGLAQALINDPDLLILDEPTNGLDPLGRMKIRKLIEQLKARGKTIFFSSHELSEIETVCDEIIMIANGRIIRQGPVAELVGDKPNLEHYFLEALQQDAGQD
ncbi:putative ABC transporter ATP-binding protein YxlF [Pontiella desulfatans]|uniref:Putative ABC transporter ATP-binding protein YxlF n=1 Tax=Pontiella desulfatans TaxID=2750659 RepID=A0A6C2U7V1_PONDE|nr:ABC transporter ATP-binding protein [Pontiella desulfatans]VGO15949.1 putative ABC transporter ATP-binding protein YxlF [Pontiella desulfatans]